MGDQKRHPKYRAIQQSMESIVEMVSYNDVKDKVFSKELLLPEDLDQYDKLTNAEAVRRMTRKLMLSFTGCEEFLKILQEMTPPQYNELAKIIDEKYEQIKAEDSSKMQHQNQLEIQEIEHSFEQQVENAIQSIPQMATDQVKEMLEESQEIVDTILEQDVDMAAIINAMRAQKIAGKIFTELLICTIRMFRTAIKNDVICLKKSRQPIIQQLHKSFVTLKCTHKDFCGTIEDKAVLDNSIAVVVLHSNKILAVVKSMQKVYWLKCSQSAQTISALLPIYEKITKVVEGIKEINCKPFVELLGNVNDLKDSLAKIENILFLTTEIVGLSTSFIFATAGAACMLAGVILLITPAAPVGLPLVLTGGVVTVMSLVPLLGSQPFYFITITHFAKSKKEGQKRSEELVKDQPSTLKTEELLKSLCWSL